VRRRRAQGAAAFAGEATKGESVHCRTPATHTPHHHASCMHACMHAPSGGPDRTGPDRRVDGEFNQQQQQEEEAPGRVARRETIACSGCKAKPDQASPLFRFTLHQYRGRLPIELPGLFTSPASCHCQCHATTTPRESSMHGKRPGARERKRGVEFRNGMQ
jgi:hypothetical protein